MMTTNYETIYIADPAISETKLGELNTKLSEIIKRFQGKVYGIDDWGSRRLGYKIKKQTAGHYVRVHYTAQGGVVSEIEHVLKLRDDVLKQLTIRLEEKKGKKDERRQ